jgi:hypothetical protein
MEKENSGTGACAGFISSGYLLVLCLVPALEYRETSRFAISQALPTSNGREKASL